MCPSYHWPCLGSRQGTEAPAKWWLSHGLGIGFQSDLSSFEAIVSLQQANLASTSGPPPCTIRRSGLICVYCLSTRRSLNS